VGALLLQISKVMFEKFTYRKLSIERNSTSGDMDPPSETANATKGMAFATF
jgi:hypothetical protein